MSEHELDASYIELLDEFGENVSKTTHVRDELNRLADTMLELSQAIRTNSRGELADYPKVKTLIKRMPVHFDHKQFLDFLQEYHDRLALRDDQEKRLGPLPEFVRKSNQLTAMRRAQKEK